MGDVVYARLDEDDFRKLVAGEEVVMLSTNGGTVLRIILADIGWDRMLRAVIDPTKQAGNVGV